MSRFPFPAAGIGWYQVAYADDLAAGAVVPVQAFGRELVVYRGEDGVARALDAHCPHLGAHLGHGGRVEGSRIRCPFHGWCFDESGACVDVPDAPKLPPRARLGPWPVRETAGLLLVHHHPAGAAPAAEPPAFEAVTSAAYSWPYVRRAWRFRSHAQDVAENLVDASHFRHVHGIAALPRTTAEVVGPELRARTQLVQRTPRGDVPTQIEIVGHGPGLWTARFTGIVETLAVIGLTPGFDEWLDVRMSFVVSREGGGDPHRGVGAAMIAEISHQTDEDIVIWEHKVYRERPILTALDGPLQVLRSWARQFYPPERAPS